MRQRMHKDKDKVPHCLQPLASYVERPSDCVEVHGVAERIAGGVSRRKFGCGSQGDLVSSTVHPKEF